jgi:hypothetical protein
VVSKNHGRIEVRQCRSISNPEELDTIRHLERWKGIQLCNFETHGTQLAKAGDHGKGWNKGKTFEIRPGYRLFVVGG